MSTIIRVYNSRDSTVDLENITEFKNPCDVFYTPDIDLLTIIERKDEEAFRKWQLRTQETLSE